MSILLNKTTPATGKAFVELADNGEVLAGETQESARRFASIKEAHDHWFAYYREGVRKHTAWNICSVLEDLLPKEGEGAA